MEEQKKKGGLLSGIGKLFVEEVPVPAMGADQASAAGVSSSPSTGDKPVFGLAGSSGNAVRPTVRKTVLADPTIVEKIKNKIDSETHEAYLRFTELLAELSPIIEDEAARMKAALVSMKKLGFDEQMVLGIYNARVNALEEFGREFETAHKRKLEEIGSQAEAEISQIDKSVQKLEGEITDLTQKLMAEKSRRSQVDNTRKEEFRSISTKGSETKTAIDAVRQELEHERDTVSRLIS